MSRVLSISLAALLLAAVGVVALETWVGTRSQFAQEKGLAEDEAPAEIWRSSR